MTLTPGNGSGSTVEWTLFALDQPFPARVFNNTMVSSYAGVMATEVARIDNDGTITVPVEYGDWINGTPTLNGTGKVDVAINAGIFSQTPVCQCIVVAATDNQICTIDGAETLSSTAFSYTTERGNDELDQNADVFITCTGPR